MGLLQSVHPKELRDSLRYHYGNLHLCSVGDHDQHTDKPQPVGAESRGEGQLLRLPPAHPQRSEGGDHSAAGGVSALLPILPVDSRRRNQKSSVLSSELLLKGPL